MGRSCALIGVLLVGCADASATPSAPPVALFADDGGVESHLGDWTEPGPELGNDLSLERRICTGRALACPDGCPRGQGCCVTGVRARGTCTAARDCPDQCAYDCDAVGRRWGLAAMAQCESLCLFLPADLRCDPPR